MTYTYTTDHTFTKTDAEYIASKVAADLHGLRSYYKKPDEHEIYDYQVELVELMAEGCVKSVEYGFRRKCVRIVTLKYDVQADGSLSDGASGRVYARADTSGATWFSYMIYSDKWYRLSDSERQKIKKRINIDRHTGDEPQDGSGYWVEDKSYSSGGVGAQRRSFRPH